MAKSIGVKGFKIGVIPEKGYEVVIVKQLTEDGQTVDFALSPDEARDFIEGFQIALEELEERM